ncbi:hypothetical protein [Streptomyces roseifaciens]|uniref:hypothetical protein n=1 Tax=Streptomyces roseifaciens TaxID=1488406 RepID=UPI000AEB0144|nr:hypothetical protein [Streptomyces roseifaciens]
MAPTIYELPKASRTTGGYDPALAPSPTAKAADTAARHADGRRQRRWPHGDELKKRVADYPKTSAAQPEWWSRTADWVAEIANTVDDYRACGFIHVAQAAWKRKTLPWVRLYRRNTSAAHTDADAGADAGRSRTRTKS